MPGKKNKNKRARNARKGAGSSSTAKTSYKENKSIRDATAGAVLISAEKFYYDRKFDRCIEILKKLSPDITGEP
ncbi:MAG: hypothetical protein AB1746_03630, partial [Candidatus Zixiibacteriota bacterium]